MMVTTHFNVGVRDDLFKTAAELSGLSSPAAIFDEALDAYIKHLRRLKTIKSSGTFDFADDAEFKAMRRD